MTDHGHSPEEIQQRIQSPQQSYLRDWVYGGIDGAITTFAIVTGVVGADLSSRVIIILGFANLLADGFSMAASNYLATKTEEDQYKHYKTFEQEQIEIEPTGETEEVRQIYQQKGFQGKVLEKIVRLITSNKKLWLETMLREEYGLPAKTRNPRKAAISTFAAFIICGFIPLLPYIFQLTTSFLSASISTGLVFFSIGSIQSRWSIHPWWRTGLSTFLIGSIAAFLAYSVGYLFQFFI